MKWAKHSTRPHSTTNVSWPHTFHQHREELRLYLGPQASAPPYSPISLISCTALVLSGHFTLFTYSALVCWLSKLNQIKEKKAKCSGCFGITQELISQMPRVICLFHAFSIYTKYPETSGCLKRAKWPNGLQQQQENAQLCNMLEMTLIRLQYFHYLKHVLTPTAKPYCHN